MFTSFDNNWQFITFYCCFCYCFCPYRSISTRYSFRVYCIIIIQHSWSVYTSIPSSFHFTSWQTNLDFISHINYGMTLHLQCNRNGRPRCGIRSRLTFRWGHVSHTHKAVRDVHLSYTQEEPPQNKTVTFGKLWAGRPCHYQVNFNSFHAKNETAR
jgi:hypothetical protein